MRSSLERKLPWVLESSEWLYQQRNWKNVTSMSSTARTKLALQCGWQDGRLFQPTVTRGEAIRMLSHMLVRKKKKKARKVTMKNFLLKRANQMLFNGLAHCNKVMLSNCPFHVLTRDLGENATAKVFFNVFIDDAYIDKIIPYAHPKGDQMFTTTRVEISAYLGLNILIKIHELRQLAMYWDSDKFIKG